MSYTGLLVSVFGHDIDDSQSFSERIVTLQTETRYLCTHIEDKSLGTTKRFKRLLQDAHIYCPDMKAMEPALVNIETMANTYYSFIIQQLDDCQELSKMLTKGLENGGLVVYYLKEGNYSLVTSIIDKWHETFTKFHATFYLTDTPLDIMLKNNKIFYHDDKHGNKTQSISRWILTIVGSVAFPSMLVWVSSTFGIVAKLSQILMIFRQQTDSSESGARQTAPDGNGRRYWWVIQRIQSFVSKLINRIVPVRKTPVSIKFCIIPILIFVVVLVAVIWIFYPSTTPVLKSVRRRWYPDATTTLDTMRADSDNLQANLSLQIRSIEELQHHASMYHDDTIQANVDEFINILGQGTRQVSKELSEAYILSEKMPSTFRRAYKSIEAQAKKVGKLSEVKDLLAELDKSAERYGRLQRALQTSVVHQQKVLPILKQQTQSMQALVRDDRLIEIGRIINHHQDALIEIDGTIFKVQIELTNFIQIVSDEHIDGMKKMIKSLSEDSVTDQIKGMITGIGGATTSTVMGALAIKTGYALVTVTATVAAGPALGVAGVLGGIGMVGFGGYWAANKFDQYKEASHYQNELAALETARMNLQVAMEKVREGITAQQASLESSQSSLRKIAEYCGQFSKIPGFTLNRIQRTAINDELLNAIMEYNRMMAVYSLFAESVVNNDRALPAA